MGYSKKLNGYWEEGYHYYMEFNNGRLIVRDYRRAIAIDTKISYDAKALERGERTVISLKDNVLSRDGSGQPFTMIRELAYEDGKLHMLYYYTIMGETNYVLTKVDHDPFSHILIRDKEFLPSLQGRWEEWCRDGSEGYPIEIRGNKLSMLGIRSAAFHVVSYKYEPEKVWLVPENLIDRDFPGYSSIEVRKDMLTTRMQMCDAVPPLSVFARREMLNKIQIPPEALAKTVYTMLRREPTAAEDLPDEKEN